MTSYNKISHWLDRAVERIDEVWKIMGMVDWTYARRQAMEWARRNHIQLLKTNRDILRRVRTTAELFNEFSKGFSIFYAMGITQILETIKEGEEIFYLNLKFTKKEGEVRAEKVGWDWAEEVF